MLSLESFDPIQHAAYAHTLETLDTRALKITERDAPTAGHTFPLVTEGEWLTVEQLNSRATEYLGLIGLHAYQASIRYLPEAMRKPAWVRRQSGMVHVLLAGLGQPAIHNPRLEAAEIDDADLQPLPNVEEVIIQTASKIMLRAELKFSGRPLVTGEASSLITVRAAEASSRPVLSFRQRRDRAHTTFLKGVRTGKRKP